MVFFNCSSAISSCLPVYRAVMVASFNCLSAHNFSIRDSCSIRYACSRSPDASCTILMCSGSLIWLTSQHSQKWPSPHGEILHGGERTRLDFRSFVAVLRDMLLPSDSVLSLQFPPPPPAGSESLCLTVAVPPPVPRNVARMIVVPAPAAPLDAGEVQPDQTFVWKDYQWRCWIVCF